MWTVRFPVLLLSHDISRFKELSQSEGEGMLFSVIMPFSGMPF